MEETDYSIWSLQKLREMCVATMNCIMHASVGIGTPILYSKTQVTSPRTSLSLSGCAFWQDTNVTLATHHGKKKIERSFLSYLLPKSINPCKHHPREKKKERVKGSQKALQIWFQLQERRMLWSSRIRTNPGAGDAS